MKSALTLVLRRALPCLLLLASSVAVFGTEPAQSTEPAFPTALEVYADNGAPLWEKLVGREHADPFNLVASVIFLLAIIHTFLAAKFRKIAHHFEHEHELLLRQPAPSPLWGAYIRSTGSMPRRRRPVSMTAQVREQSMRRRAFTAGSSTMTLSAA